VTRRRRAAWWVVTVFAALVALYGLSYLLFRDRMFPEQLADSFNARPWGIFPHVLFGGLALLIGPFQFHPRVQTRTSLHRKLGLAYVTVAFLAGAAGFYMAIYSYGGWPTHGGFGLLGLGTMLATAMAFRYAKAGDFRHHREWVIRSFAFIFAAPTQRLWLGIGLAGTQGNFDVAYPWSSWLCWVLNLMVAEWFIRTTRREPLRFAGAEMETA
jgi:uncharacterized membrane protein